MEAVGDSVSLGVSLEEAGDVVVDFRVDLREFIRFEVLLDEVPGSPFFEGIVVLRTELGYADIRIV